MHLRLLLIGLVLHLQASTQLSFPFNGGFELQRSNEKFLLWNLFDLQGQYTLRKEQSGARSGRYALVLDGVRAQRTDNKDEWGSFFLGIPASVFEGKKQLKLTVWVRIEDSAQANIWVQQVGSSGQAVQEAFSDSSKAGWQLVVLEAGINPKTTQYYIGGSLNGKGRVWFDDLIIHIDGQPVRDIAQTPPPPKPAEIAWIRKHALPLLSLTASEKTSDLKALLEVQTTARIIALGEPTHGTGAVFSLRLRLLQYLVAKEGFNTLMIEDNLAEAGRLNDYVLKGIGSPKELIGKHLFPVWRTEELLALVEWMRSYNLQHEKKLQFRGMDMQSGAVARENLYRFAAARDTALQRLIPRPEQGNGLAAAQALYRHFERMSSQYEKRVPEDTLKWMWLNVEVLRQLYPTIDGGMSTPYRDSCMAQNILTFSRQYPDSKMLIWAHNSHAGREQGMMGHWLDKSLGKGYFPIAFATSEGTYTASVDFAKTSWKVFDLEAPYPGTVEYFLQQGSDQYILPLRSLKEEALESSWLIAPSVMRSVGFMNMSDQFFPTVLAKEFDAVIFVRRTGHSRSFMLKQ